MLQFAIHTRPDAELILTGALIPYGVELSSALLGREAHVLEVALMKSLPEQTYLGLFHVMQNRLLEMRATAIASRMGPDNPPIAILYHSDGSREIAPLRTSEGANQGEGEPLDDPRDIGIYHENGEGEPG